MDTNNNEKIEVNGAKYNLYIIDGVEGVDGKAAMDIIGYGYANQLHTACGKGKIKMLGEVQAKGKVNKNIYKLDDVIKVWQEFRPRGTDTASRFEIEMFPDILQLAINDLLELVKDKDAVNVIDLILALQKARNLTEERREKNQAKKA